MEVDLKHTTREFCCLVIDLLNPSQLSELKVLRVLIILCCKSISAHRIRNEQSRRDGSEEDVCLEVNGAKWLTSFNSWEPNAFGRWSIYVSWSLFRMQGADGRAESTEASFSLWEALGSRRQECFPYWSPSSMNPPRAISLKGVIEGFQQACRKSAAPSLFCMLRFAWLQFPSFLF